MEKPSTLNTEDEERKKWQPAMFFKGPLGENILEDVVVSDDTTPKNTNPLDESAF